MHLFIDTNVLIDLVADRKPFSAWAFKIFQDQKKGKWELWASDNSILTTYYILSKRIGNSKAKKTIKILLSRLNIISIQREDLLEGLDIPFKDYEDGVQFLCAKRLNKIDKIVTRNKKDFRNSTINIISPEELYLPKV